jgi:hypothetical protein
MLGRISSEDTGFQQMIQQTGFDPRRDVEDVLFLSAATEAGTTNSQFGILVRGNFDHDRVQKSILAQGATIQMYQGVAIYVSGSHHNGAKQHRGTAVAFADVDIAAMGDLATVEQILADRSNPTTLDPALQQLVSTAGANHDVWFASITAGSFLADKMGSGQLGSATGQAAGPAAGAQALQSILQSSGGVSFGNVVDASFDALARSPKDATSISDVVRFLASMVQMQRQADPRVSLFSSSLDNMTLQTNGSTVHIGLSIPESNLEQLAAANAPNKTGGAVR